VLLIAFRTLVKSLENQVDVEFVRDCEARLFCGPARFRGLRLDKRLEDMNDDEGDIKC
jgi:hypothetical protein